MRIFLRRVHLNSGLGLLPQVAMQRNIGGIPLKQKGREMQQIRTRRSQWEICKGEFERIFAFILALSLA